MYCCTGEPDAAGGMTPPPPPPTAAAVVDFDEADSPVEVLEVEVGDTTGDGIDVDAK